MHGGHLMPVHKLIFVIMHGLFGYDATPFFALALATHLLNIALFYLALRQVVRAPLAAFGAALWALRSCISRR
jgi:high-affinity Fe2+/Pb2+ permease